MSGIAAAEEIVLLSVWNCSHLSIQMVSHISRGSCCQVLGVVFMAPAFVFTRSLNNWFTLSSYRIALAFTGISLLVVGTTMVGYLPNGR